MRAVLALSVALALVAAAGCGGDGGGADPSELEDAPWVLVSGQDIDLTGGEAPSAAFTDGGVFGGNGCNRYRGTYAVDGDSLTIEASGQTLKACPPPNDAIESAYMAALGEVASWEVDGEELVLSDADGNELLRYEVTSIVGEWTVTGILDADRNAFSSPIAGTEITAAFGEDGTLAGSGGCNNYTTSYEASEGDITIEPAAATQKLCSEPEGVMDQEAAYFAALGEATQYNLDGSTAELLNAEGTRLIGLARATP